MADSPLRSKLPSGEVLGMLLLAAAALLVVLSNRDSTDLGMPVAAGTPLPELMAEGWLHSAGPPSVRGKVVVVDCWATWCGPCRAAMPELVRLYQQYQPLGVEFVGLTQEGAAQLPAIEGFLSAVDGAHWPVGYGAGPTFDMLGINAIPTLIVFNAEGRAVWSGYSTDTLAAALDQAVALAK